MRLHAVRTARAAQRGSALALALLVMVLVSAMGFAFLGVTSSVTRRQSGSVEASQAFYIAEAGLAEAFAAVRIGRSGQIGTQAQPAAYGGGLLWVDATETRDGQVRLISQGYFGSARSGLSLVVEPVEQPLGFFADEDLVLDSVLLMDGFDSSQATYAEELQRLAPPAPDPPQDPDLPEYPIATALAFEETFVGTYGTEVYARMLADAGDITFTESGVYYAYEYVEDGRVVTGNIAAANFLSIEMMLPTLRPVYPSGYYNGRVMSWSSWTGEFPDEEPDRLSESTQAVGEAYKYVETSPGGVPTNTEDGALLGSNGNVSFELDAAESIAIWGDVMPGPEGEVLGLGGDTLVHGETEPRPERVELPEVEVPGIPLDPALRHDGLLPLLVPAGLAGYESLEIAEDSEMILRGPATVVIGELRLEPGALLTLDTRDGDVALYVTGSMELAPGSEVVTTSEMPDETTIQVSSSQTGGDPLVQLEATSSFHGTIYAPQADVRVGSDFEVFGGIVARRLEIGPGAKLHFDSAGYEGTPIPRLVSWRITELPVAAGGLVRDPFLALGLDRADASGLADGHVLAGVQLDLEYLDAAGAIQTYSGDEAAFNWDAVDSVLEVHRNADRLEEAPAGLADVEAEEPGAADPDAWVQQESDIWPGCRKGVSAPMIGSFLLSDAQLLESLMKCSPLRDAEMKRVIDHDPAVRPAIIEQLDAAR